MSYETFLETYKEFQQREEIVLLNDHLVPYLRDAAKQFWMITFISKQDLWWNCRRDVEDCYKSGEYGSLIERLRVHRGANFDHEYSSGCLRLENFSTGKGEVLLQTAAGYDASIRSANLASFTRLVAAKLGLNGEK